MKESLSVRAHIPSINVSWGKLNEDGTIKSVSELKEIYADAGIDGSKYHKIGERSSHHGLFLILG